MNTLKNKLASMNAKHNVTIEIFQKQLASCKRVITSYQYVVEVGLHTVTKNNVDSTIQYKTFDQLPSQWNMKGVNEIKKALTNIGKDIKCYEVSEWYAKQIELLNGCIQSNNNMISTL
jgi:hypothetical protein